jgi:hypothetical protein
LPDLFDAALVESPAGKVPVRIHAGKTVDKRPPCKVELFDVDLRE